MCFLLYNRATVAYLQAASSLPTNIERIHPCERWQCGGASNPAHFSPSLSQASGRIPRRKWEKEQTKQAWRRRRPLVLVQVQSALHSEIFLQPRQKQNAATLARRTETSFFFFLCCQKGGRHSVWGGFLGVENSAVCSVRSGVKSGSGRRPAASAARVPWSTWIPRQVGGENRSFCAPFLGCARFDKWKKWSENFVPSFVFALALRGRSLPWWWAKEGPTAMGCPWVGGTFPLVLLF